MSSSSSSSWFASWLRSKPTRLQNGEKQDSVASKSLEQKTEVIFAVKEAVENELAAMVVSTGLAGDTDENEIVIPTTDSRSDNTSIMDTGHIDGADFGRPRVEGLKHTQSRSDPLLLDWSTQQQQQSNIHSKSDILSIGDSDNELLIDSDDLMSNNSGLSDRVNDDDYDKVTSLSTSHYRESSVESGDLGMSGASDADPIIVGKSKTTTTVATNSDSSDSSDRFWHLLKIAGKVAAWACILFLLAMRFRKFKKLPMR